LAFSAAVATAGDSRQGENVSKICCLHEKASLRDLVQAGPALRAFVDFFHVGA
jgi:hypothetical protein